MTRTDTAVLDRLATVVRAKRLERGWSQQRLADEVDVSRDVIKRVEAACPGTRFALIVGGLLPALGCTLVDYAIISGAKRVRGPGPERKSA